jgi:hypothetical protein
MEYLLSPTTKFHFMKKYLFLTFILGAVIATTTNAQTAAAPATAQNAASDAAAMLQRTKEKVVAPMVEKTGLTEAQANRVVEINFEMRQTMMNYKDLNEEERSKKVAELKAARDKKLSEIPLTPEQIESVFAFYKDMGKNGPAKN